MKILRKGSLGSDFTGSYIKECIYFIKFGFRSFKVLKVLYATERSRGLSIGKDPELEISFDVNNCSDNYLKHTGGIFLEFFVFLFLF